MIQMKKIEGGKRDTDRADDLCRAIKAAIYDNAEGMSLAAVIGCLEIAKFEIMEDQSD